MTWCRDASHIFRASRRFRRTNSVASRCRCATLCCRDSAAFVHNPQGEACGFVVMPLDLSDPLRAMRGRSDWLSRLKFFGVRRGVRSVLLHSAGLVPEEAKKHSGLGAALIAHVTECVLQRCRRPSLAALVAETSASRGHLNRYAAAATREYTLFEVPT